MSTEVATPTVIPTEPTTTTTAAESPAVFVEEEEAPKVGEQVESKTETPSTPTATSKEEHKKRSPFGDLKNKLFNKSPSQPTSPTAEHADPVKEIAPTPVVVEEERASKENATPVVADEETPAVVVEEAPATESPPVEEKPVEKKEKVKTPLFEKMKSFFGEPKEKKEKKAKTPTEEKSEPVVETSSTSTPEVSSPTPEVVASPSPISPSTEEVPSVDVTSPEAVALAEASANASAPVPQIVDGGNPIDAPTTEQVETQMESVKPVEATTPAVESTPVVETPKEEVKFDEAAKTEDKPPKKDLAKLGRRLSARLGAMISPKKEKKESEVMPVVAAQETPASTTESTESKVEEPVVETPSATTEETAIAPKIEESTLPIAVEEPAKVEETKTDEVVAPIDAPAEELAADLKKDEPTTTTA
ncbi:hypothetical protein JCM5353_002321 [Sporobolomyces roseus]